MGLDNPSDDIQPEPKAALGVVSVLMVRAAGEVVQSSAPGTLARRRDPYNLVQLRKIVTPRAELEAIHQLLAGLQFNVAFSLRRQ